MKTYKKLFSFILVIILIFSVVPMGTFTFTVSAETTTSGTTGECTWSLDGTTLTISGNGRMGEYFDVSAPWGVNITEVIIEDGVQTIGWGAFENCKNLTSVKLGNDIKFIDSSAFNKCYSLTDIVIPEGVERINSDAFYYCSELTSITIPKSLKYIGSDAFMSCDKLTNVYISDIAAWCNIDFGKPYSTRYNYSNPLFYASNFYVNGDLLIDVVIPEGVTTIPYGAFYNCDSIKSVTMPDSLTTIKELAFCGSDGLESIEIHDGITNIGSRAFSGCLSLSGITVSENNSVYRSIDNVLFNKDATTLINYPCAKENTSYTVPNSVKNIDKYAFSDCKNLTSVIISDNVISIDERAFAFCESLISVEMGSGLQSIGINAFYSCINIMSITIGNNVTSIGDYAFYKCENLTTVKLGRSVTNIGDYAFSYTNLKGIEIPDSATNISNCAFSSNVVVYGKTGSLAEEFANNFGYKFIPLEEDVYFDGTFYKYTVNNNTATIIDVDDSISGKVVVPSFLGGYLVTDIAESAFASCDKITALTIGDCVENIGEYAFNSCEELVEVTVSGNNLKIGEYAFAYCRNLTKASILDGVISIGASAFAYCSNLTNITIADSVEYIGGGLIYETKLYNNWTSGTLYIDNHLIDVKSSFSGSLRIKNGTKTIASYACDMCSKITSITIPDSVIGIGDEAFYACNKITSITIPDSVISIGDKAFYGMKKITSITIPASVKYIGYGAFNSCEALTSVVILGNVEHIKASAFAYCENINEVHITSLENWCNIDFENSESNPLTLKGVLYLNGETLTGSIVLPDGCKSIPAYTFKNSNITEITIPDSVATIGDYAFYRCESITDLSVPDSVVSIGENVFKYCTNLETLSIGDGVTVIHHEMFKELMNLRDVTIGNGVTVIKSNAFYNCESLTNLRLGNGIKTIEEYVFFNCYNLKNVYIEDVSAWCSIDFISNPLRYAETLYLNGEEIVEVEIEEGVTSIGHYAFYGCDKLESIIIPESVTSIGNYAFDSCVNLKDINLHDNISTIGTRAFAFCTKLKSVTIPQKVTTISNETFATCIGLENVVFHDGITSIGADAFCYCTGLTSIKLPNGLTSFGDEFTGCSNVIDLTIPASVTSIAGGFDFINLENIYITDMSAWCNIDFEYYSLSPLSVAENLYLNGELVTDLVIPEDVTEISPAAFKEYIGLKSVTIHDNVTSIGDYAFYQCCNLTDITIGSGITSLKTSVFDGCYNIKNIYINDLASWCNIDFENYSNYETYRVANPTKYGADLYLNGELLIDLIIPDGVTTIKDCAFYNYQNIKSIVIPDSVVSIGEKAFDKCQNIESISIGKGIKDIGDDAFSSGINKDIYISDLSAWCNIAFSNYNSNPLYEEDTLYLNGDLITDLIIPEDVTTIGYAAFVGFNGISSVTIPNNVTYICSKAFEQCMNLTSVKIGNGITTIENGAFYDCLNIKDVYISDITSWCNIDFNSRESNLLYYAKNLYVNGELLTDLTIPDSVTTIPQYAFYNCDSIKSVEIGNNVTNIGDFAFYNCDSIKSLKIGNNVISIGNNAFYDCDNLNEVVISDSVMLIGESAFAGCYSLMSVTIGKSVQKICDGAFDYCDNLWHILYTAPEASWYLIDLGSSAYTLANTTRHCYANGNEVYVSSGKASCTSTTTGSASCSICSEKKTIEVRGGNHKLDKVVKIVEPTCDDYGYTEYSCSLCNKVFIDDYVYPLGHNIIVLNVKSGSCTEKEIIEYGCTKCNYTYTSTSTTHFRHFFRYSSYVDAKCFENGYYEEYCIHCGIINKNVLESTGHNYYDDLCSICAIDRVDAIESDHSYESNCDQTWSITKTGANCIEITFSSKTETEKDCDFVYIYDANDKLIGKYSGKDLSSKTVVVDSDTVKIRLTSNESNNYYGFSIQSVCDYIKCVGNGIEVQLPSVVSNNNYTLQVRNIDIDEIPSFIPDNEDVESWIAYDINFEHNGETVHPKGEKIVKIPVLDEMNSGNYVVYNISDDGNLTDVNAEIINGNMVFSSETLGRFVLVELSPEYISGDINNDGKINNRDLVRLQQYLAEWDVEIVEGNSDVDRNGRINNRDLVRLQQYLAEWDVELL